MEYVFFSFVTWNSTFLNLWNVTCICLSHVCGECVSAFVTVAGQWEVSKKKIICKQQFNKLQSTSFTNQEDLPRIK